jgi:hypothetical protein
MIYEALDRDSLEKSARKAIAAKCSSFLHNKQLYSVTFEWHRTEAWLAQIGETPAHACGFLDENRPDAYGTKR